MAAKRGIGFSLSLTLSLRLTKTAFVLQTLRRGFALSEVNPSRRSESGRDVSAAWTGCTLRTTSRAYLLEHGGYLPDCAVTLLNAVGRLSPLGPKCTRS